ncbi:MAG: hypothetical protein FJ399_08470, partial [Verrucomicrobia bacterium]|nr:hypothetical protein [Verrucomicrobiota bacterium]
MITTLSPEMDAWLAEQRLLEESVIGRRMPGAAVLQDRDLDVVPPCPLIEAEIDWLWPRYQRCSFPPATFAKRFACTPRERLTPRGKNAAVKLAYRFRRQIFGKQAVKWGDELFLSAVRYAASRAGGPKHATTTAVGSDSPADAAP